MPDSRVKLREPRIGLLTAIGRSLRRRTSSPSSGQLVQLVMRVVAVEHVQRDDQFLERGVAGALAEPVRAAVHDFGAGFDRRQFGGHRHPEVVVGMRLHLQAVGELLHQPHHVLHAFRQDAAHGVDDAD